VVDHEIAVTSGTDHCCEEHIMSTILSDHPPQLRAEQHLSSSLPVRRPSALDRLALRAGLLLITYGRRRYALSREQSRARAETVRTRATREREWERTRHLLLPPR
jgi:hypothetical protein